MNMKKKKKKSREREKKTIKSNDANPIKIQSILTHVGSFYRPKKNLNELQGDKKKKDDDDVLFVLFLAS